MFLFTWARRNRAASFRSSEANGPAFPPAPEVNFYRDAQWTTSGVSADAGDLQLSEYVLQETLRATRLGCHAGSGCLEGSGDRVGGSCRACSGRSSGSWSKYAGPEPEVLGCRAPRETLDKVRDRRRQRGESPKCLYGLSEQKSNNAPKYLDQQG